MRIIKENKSEERIKKCKYCKTIMAYTYKDIDHHCYPTIRCPVCGRLLQPSIFDKKVKK